MLNSDRLTYDSLLKQCSGLYQICGPEDIKSITILSSYFILATLSQFVVSMEIL